LLAAPSTLGVTISRSRGCFSLLKVCSWEAERAGRGRERALMTSMSSSSSNYPYFSVYNICFLYEIFKRGNVQPHTRR
jgi:hypothetical protein